MVRAAMDRVLVLGRGGAGKSVLARRLGDVLGMPVVELDKVFWAEGLSPMPPERWIAVQQRLVAEPRWILDGDLGPYDVLAVRLAAADTVVILDFPLWRCTWQAVRRDREGAAFWRWAAGYRRRSLPVIMAAVARHARHAELHVFRQPGDVERFLVQAVLRRDQ